MKNLFDKIKELLKAIPKLYITILFIMNLIIIVFFYIILFYVPDNNKLVLEKLLLNIKYSYPAFFVLSIINLFIALLLRKLNIANSFIRLLCELITFSFIGIVYYVLVMKLFFDYERYSNFIGFVTSPKFGKGAAVTTFLNIISLIMIELIFNYHERKKVEIEFLELKSENNQFLYEQLKNQINPHFLFNSLNIISSLIHIDKDKALECIQMLSKIYRYVLANENKELIELGDEIEFIEVYSDLLKMRFGNAIEFKISVEPELYEKLISPMALQVLIENIVKHNVVSSNSPIVVFVYAINDMIYVKNNRNKRVSIDESFGIGLKNLNRRYDIISGKKIIIKDEKDTFEVGVPLL